MPKLVDLALPCVSGPMFFAAPAVEDRDEHTSCMKGNKPKDKVRVNIDVIVTYGQSEMLDGNVLNPSKYGKSPKQFDGTFAKFGSIVPGSASVSLTLRPFVGLFIWLAVAT